MSVNLFEQWDDLVSKYSRNTKHIVAFYEQIVKDHSEEHRHYHNLHHIEHLLFLAGEHKTIINNYDIFRFAIWFHDIIYDPKKRINEEMSADKAFTILSYFSLPIKSIEEVAAMIIKTRHQISISEYESEDVHFFLDCDLEILASDRERFDEYRSQIRQENLWVGDKYNQLRSDFLNEMLNKEFIYHSETGREKWENKARENIKYELQNLSV